jgi:hypothetical protein
VKEAAGAEKEPGMNHSRSSIHATGSVANYAVYGAYVNTILR